MSPVPIREVASGIDLSPRFGANSTIVASPALAAETIIASITIPNFGDTPVQSGIVVNGWAAYTLGTSATSANMRIRQTNVTGTVIAATGLIATGHTAGLLVADDVNGFDTAPGVATYVLTLIVTAGAAQSTVSAAYIAFTVI